jgi:hypothetical protein
MTRNWATGFAPPMSTIHVIQVFAAYPRRPSASFRPILDLIARR